MAFHRFFFFAHTIAWLGAFGAITAELNALDIYYQGVHQESSIKQQPPATFDRILGLYLSDRNRPFKLPVDDSRKDLIALEKTLHLRAYSRQTQNLVDRTLDRSLAEDSGLQVVEAFVQTVDFNPSQVRLGKFISQLQGEIYPKTPYSSGFVTPPEFVLASFGAEGLTGIGAEWVQYFAAALNWDITYQFMRPDNRHQLLVGPHHNGNLHSIGINAFGSIDAARSYGFALKAGGMGIGSDDQVTLWTGSAHYSYVLLEDFSLKAEAKWLSTESRADPDTKVKGGYLFQAVARIANDYSIGFRRDASGAQAESFDGLVRDAIVGSVWLSQEVAVDLQKTFLNPKGASAFNQSHIQLRISLLQI